MKKLSQFLSFCALAAVLLAASGCVQNQPRRYVRSNHFVPRSPYIGSPEWITWVDHKVDTRYSNGIRPDPGTQEWYAIVDHVVFADYSNDYYRNVYRDQYRSDYQRYYGIRDGRTTSRNYADYNDRGDRPVRGDYSGDSFPRSGSTGDRYARSNYRDNYRYTGERYSHYDYRGDGSRLRLGTVEWKKAVTYEIVNGHVPPPPPRSDPWDAPLAPTH